jgi:glucose-6-phosphate dehydrogenase assembly protein OpcA
MVLAGVMSQETNPEVIERELAQLWQQTASAQLRDLEPGKERATLRARAANLMVYGSNAESLEKIDEVLQELSARHPCRALVMIDSQDRDDHDIEVSVDSFCHENAKQQHRHLCCEEIALKASGRFVVELPSAAIPLLVPDLPVFLWWREDLQTNADVFTELAHRSDRVIIDSANFIDGGKQISALKSLLAAEPDEPTAFSDMNWARLTSWRALLASFFDTTPNRDVLEKLVSVVIEYSACDGLSAQPLLIAGWLADRLDWKVIGNAERAANSSQTVRFEKHGRKIDVAFVQVERPQLQPGRLARVELATESSVTFAVTRSADGLHLETIINAEQADPQGGASQSHTRSVADLLGGEMEIVCRDRVWEDALAKAAEIVGMGQ